MKYQAVGAALACLLGSAIAEDGRPTQPVTVYVGHVPGGTTDIVMRQLTTLMQPKFPAGLIVMNRPGAGGVTALSALTQAKPDGYQFLLAPNSNVALSPQVLKTPFKNPDDVEYVAEVTSFSPVLVVPSASQYKTLAQLVSDAKKESESKVSVGFPGVSTFSQFSVQSLAKMSGASLIEVPFTGWGQGGPQLLGGQVSAAVAQPTDIAPQVKAGTLRVLASFSEKRQTGLPEVPTAKEQGFPISVGVRYMMLAHKNTPKQAINYMHDALKAAMDTPQFRELAKNGAMEVTYRDGASAKAQTWADYRKASEMLKQVK